MKNNNDHRHVVDVLFVLTLFGVFAASALMLVTIGANVYKKTVANMDSNFTDRTAYSYVMEKIRQNDSNDMISVDEIAGIPALAFTQSNGEEEFCTYLYLYEGQLKELFVRKDSFSGTNILSAGQDIMPLSAFTLEETTDGLIRLMLDTGNGESIILYASPHSDCP